MQNWNDGKSQEFADRKTYKPELGTAPSADATPIEPAAPAEDTPKAESADVCTLFVTATCPNCRIVKPLLDKAGIAYEVKDVAEYPDLARQYNLKQAPTLVVENGEDAKLYVGVNAIKGYIKG